MLIYNYHPVTKEYLGSEEACPSPLEKDVFLIPAFSTPVTPPDVPVGHAAVFDGSAAWVVLVDNRGKSFWRRDGSEHVVEHLGESIPDDVFLERPVSIFDVINERSRRLSLGFDYDFSDSRGIHRIGTTPDDMSGWDEVTKYANALLAVGDLSSLITIFTNTGVAKITALEWQDVLIAANAFRQPIWRGSFILQTSDPIPIDFRDDRYWSMD